MSGRSLLRVLPSPHDVVPEVRFCGYCGGRPAGRHDARVCPDCHLGLMLTASAALAPAPGQAALIVDHSLSVCAISQAAETLLGVSEPDVVRRPLGDVLVPAQAEGAGLESLVATILAVAAPGQEPRRMVVRPAGEWGIRYAVRIGACGPPRGVLLVLDDDEV